MKNKKIIAVVVVVIVGFAAYKYETRPLEGSSKNINASVSHLTPSTSSDIKTLHIAQNSTAQFELNELLNKSPKHVVGTTNQIAGDIAIKTTSPASLTIGEIKVDARTLVTDNPKRNMALGRFILNSEEPASEYITFDSTSVTGLPDTIESGKEFSYSINGNLTIKGVTKPAMFSAKSTMNTDGSLTGTATTTVTYGDYGVNVPDLPFLANVEKQAVLTVSISAK